MAKRFPTLLALVRPLSGVNPPMEDEIGVIGKGLPTLVALVRSFSGVNPRVFDESGVLSE